MDLFLNLVVLAGTNRAGRVEHWPKVKRRSQKLTRLIVSEYNIWKTEEVIMNLWLN